nr:hypothetical protein [Chloroflexota bacterium]
MERPSNIGDSGDGASAKDDLGELIRWSFEGSLLVAEPPADVWPKILAQVREINAPSTVQRQRRRSISPLTSFIQAVVISALLLAFGLEIERNTHLARSPHVMSVTPTTHRLSVLQETYQDMLRGHMLLQKEKEQPVRSDHAEDFNEMQKPREAVQRPAYDK